MYRKAQNESVFQKIFRVLRIAIFLPWVRLFRQGPRATLIWAFDRWRLLFFGMPTLRYARVWPKLYVGGQIREKGWQRLKQDGVTAVVNMRTEHDDRANGVSIPEDHYLHLPTVDDTPVSLDDLQRGVDWIAAQIANDGAVYIHCAAGSGRAPSMGAAYLIARENMTTDEALGAIKKKRPFIMPMASQIVRLREYEAWIKNGQRAE